MQNEQPHLVVLSHYPLSEGRSMAAYRRLLIDGLTALGYKVTCRTAAIRLAQLAPHGSNAAKWLGYVDQFALFPLELLWEQRLWPKNTRVVVSDQALGPWVPLIRNWPHLIVCHDLLALRASRGEFPQQKIGITGTFYQNFIRWGFRHGQRFAAVSEASRRDLAQELPSEHAPIRVLYNPLQQGIQPLPPEEATQRLKELAPELAGKPFLMHIGTNWYKNRLGVCEIYEELRSHHSQLQLVLVGQAETALQRWIGARPDLAKSIWIFHGIRQASLKALYSKAAALLFPSYVEGFGWPVLEGLACGCPVITTKQPPLTEVGGEAAVYLPIAPAEESSRRAWARKTAIVVSRVLERSAEEQEHWRQVGLDQAARFNRAVWLEQLAALLP